jgi:pimeloyl-ACP methyl ester carboxylesterase
MPDRTVTSFADDVLVLADALEIGRFSTLGFSGGAAYALATAARAPGRVASIGLVAPLGDLGVPRLIASLEPSMRRALTIAARSQAVVRSRFVEGYDARRLMKRGAEKIWSYLPAADRRVLSRDGVRASAIGTMEEAALHGLEGVRLDAELLLAPWDFDLSEVAAPVDLFCGGADPWSTDEIAHWFKRGLRQVRLHRDPSGGHFTTLVTRADVVLGTVTNRAIDVEAQVAAASHATAV